MVKTGKWIAKHRILIVLIGILLLIPSVIGTIKTRINYDILSYLPESLETVKGQDVMVDEFGTGAFSMVVVEDMPLKDVQKLKNKFEEIEHVKKVLWYDDIADISVPTSMVPKDLKDIFFADDSTMMLVLFDNTTSSDEAMEAVTNMRAIADKQCFISGMSGVVTDIKNLCLQELPIYVAIAALFSFIVLEITGTSFVVPILFLLCIGISILYNMGTNIFLGEISYLTQALVAILQLGVTMDYSIFLLDSFEENKKRFPGDKNRAMGHAISNTFKSIVSSSITTVAGFAALCLMTFALGKNLGIVMAKGVIIGVICCVTLLPAIILIFDPLIEKTKHKPLIKNTNRLSGFIIRHYKIWLAVFCIGLLPAVYGNNNTKIYYNIDKSLPSTLDSNVANKKLEDTFDMSTMHIIMMDKNISNANKTTLMKDIEKVDGVKWAFGLNSVFGANVPASMIPKDVKDMLQSDEQELVFVCSKYSSATDESNSQIAAINDLVKKYDSNGMVIGEAPLMKDLQDVTDIDLVNVNVASVAAIFIIIMLVFKSISVPIILVAVIEFAINVNMAIPFFQGIELPFVASIVVGTIQLGATVDYAILMTSRYQKERRKGFGKKEAVMNAHKACALSIMTSGFSFFAATFGVAWYSKVDMIGAICTLLSRGALISMACVIFILPAMFIIFDKVICKTSIDFLGEKAKAKAAARA
ncbi:MMPL family transporter [Lachnospiraceae bacterium CLA-AA-H246]|uniref:MMPL family transporter n=1 Tax=Hominisplanchenecus faecis TaxID=2885351 RepID=A0ABS8EXS2_9FIRM|nr:MMPL family transporter [Hominisplanchenecus faecis]MCC2148954.1 MMPL family transporter [Hominisplanchenecus faecis]SCJ36310.1 Putative membrane protein ydgH [uncultured Ruminococcus sp.]